MKCIEWVCFFILSGIIVFLFIYELCDKLSIYSFYKKKREVF